LGPFWRCLLSARSVGVYRLLNRHDPKEYYSRFSELLLAHALRLHQSGRDDEVLYCYKEALDAQRDQNKRDPEAYSDIFLLPLAEHAHRLSSAGRFNDACTVQSEIVKIHKALYDKHPKDHFILAGHRRSYVTRLLAAGRPEDACAEELEIVKMTRVLHTSNPSEYHTVLADCLHVYADHLTSLSRLGESCLALKEEVELRRAKKTHTSRCGHFSRLWSNIKTLSLVRNARMMRKLSTAKCPIFTDKPLFGIPQRRAPW
jgi:hypothetical protein